MENIVIVLVVSAIVIAVAVYLYKSKKRGDACIGCPYAKQCQGHCAQQNADVESKE